MGTWLIVAFVLLAFAWYWRRGMKPAPNDLDSPLAVYNTLQYLIERGIEGGLVRIQLRNAASHQLKFVKYIRGMNDVGLRALIPLEQQGPESTAIVSALAAEQVPNEALHVSSEAIEVDCGADVGLAQRVLMVAFAAVFARPITDGVAYFENVLITNKASLTGSET